MNKKLQVFVSSTYKDLKEERQSAVEAILDAGHIPAGMELFKAGNESQLKTIYKWIDESDVYMLILGGRYGTIEPKSGKSYTQLEYEYALSKNIPIFAVVLSASFLTQKINSLGLNNATEQISPDKQKKFKSLVMSKLIRIVEDCKDIKIAIHSTLNTFLDEYDLTGWVRNTSETKTRQLLEDNNSLMKENSLLTKQIQKLQEQLSAKSNNTIGNFSFDEIMEIFEKKHFSLPETIIENSLQTRISALRFYSLYFHKFAIGLMEDNEADEYIFNNIAPYYISFNLLEKVEIAQTWSYKIQTTKLGNKFYSMVEADKIL